VGPERDYLTKVPSKQIRAYSTYDSSKLIKLNPWFITGFSDAEGSFMISVLSRLDSKTK
jgi:hypothetical protein